jgi:outer membrane protein OmpA-like peptidoglycan-associated protein
MERHQRIQLKTTSRSTNQPFQVSPFQTSGFGVQQKAASTPASKTELWENYQRSTQMTQKGSDPNLAGIQAKLAIGQAGDKYEQEADSVAERVMAMSEPAQVQREELGEEEEELQMKPLAGTISPLVQREELPEEEEELQMKSLDNSIQREELPEEEEELQMKESPTPNSQLPTNSLEDRLSSSKGGGSPLSDDVRSFMEPRFGADFSGVRVHTGSDAVQMNQDVNAQAFAHGQDVYFGAGKAPGKDALTAHELTHVVQQGRGINRQLIQRKIGPQHDLSQGTFDLNATPQDATSGGPNVPITIKFTPKTTAPYSNQIGLIQIVRLTDTSGGNLEPASLPAARGTSLRTQAGDGTGVDAGYFTDTLHNPSSTHPNVPSGNANQGDALAPQYPVGNGPAQPNPTTPGLFAGGAILGYKRSDDANDIKAAEITDAPGGNGEFNFAFETVAKGEDTNTVYGAVKWSFNIHGGKIENDTSSAVDNQSATFDAALERHRDFYVHEPQVFYFELDSDVLSSNEIAKIGTFKAYLARFAAAPNLVQVTPNGFADQSGKAAHNLDLSLRRATAVRDALIAQGIPEAQIQPITIGHGATKDFTLDATTDQASEANRRGNRRVVLTFEHIAAAAPSGTGGTGGTP